MKTQPCNKCKCMIKWDALQQPPMKRDKMGWWVEDLSKQLHTMDRCKTFQSSKEFMEPHAVQQAQAHPNIKEAPSPLQVKEMTVTDFAEPSMRKKIQNNLKILKIVEEEVIRFIGTDARGDKVGMWMKLIMEMMEK